MKAVESYSGELDPASITVGMNAAVRNGNRLLADARLLLSAKCYPSAVLVAILSIEEFGKVPILRELAVAKSKDDSKKVWKRYRSHTAKNALWVFDYLKKAGGKRIDDFRLVFSRRSKHRELFDKLKQTAAYSDCYGSGQWSIPQEEIDAETARWVVEACEAIAISRVITEEETRLWIKHFGQWEKADWTGMKSRLDAFFFELRERGIPVADSETVASFLE